VARLKVVNEPVIAPMVLSLVVAGLKNTLLPPVSVLTLVDGPPTKECAWELCGTEKVDVPASEWKLLVRAGEKNVEAEGPEKKLMLQSPLKDSPPKREKNVEPGSVNELWKPALKKLEVEAGLKKSDEYAGMVKVDSDAPKEVKRLKKVSLKPALKKLKLEARAKKLKLPPEVWEKEEAGQKNDSVKRPLLRAKKVSVAMP
jgi:hypothetical protein